MTELKILVLDFLSVNCYFLCNESNGDALIVDPGSSEQRIFSAIEKYKLTPKGILLTHAHVDHISAVSAVSEKYGIPVWLHKDDLRLYSSPKNELKPWMAAPENLPAPVEVCPDAGLNFRIIHTPGHTPGGVCYYFPEEKFIITGDTLFKGTYGRTDFPGGNEEQIFHSIREKLLVLEGDVTVYPGHGPATTIAKERENPVFFRN